MAQEETKKWWQSKTVWCLVITVGSYICKQKGVEFPAFINPDYLMATAGSLAVLFARSSSTPIAKSVL